MLNFSCPVCAESARVLELVTAGGRNIVRFQCDGCGESGVDNLPMQVKPAPVIVPATTTKPARRKAERKPPKPQREKRDKPKRKQKRQPRKVAIEAQVHQAWMDYVLARQAFRAGVVSRAKSDMARDAWIEVSKKLRRYEPQKDKVVA